MEKLSIPSLMGGNPIDILKANLPKTVNLKITFAIVADPDDPTKEAGAVIIREKSPEQYFKEYISNLKKDKKAYKELLESLRD